MIYGKGMGQRLQNAMGDAYAVTSIFKPNADLSNVTEDIRNLCKGLTKEDQVVIVGGQETVWIRTSITKLRKI
jgi:hypothetical protein